MHIHQNAGTFLTNHENQNIKLIKIDFINLHFEVIRIYVKITSRELPRQPGSNEETGKNTSNIGLANHLNAYNNVRTTCCAFSETFSLLCVLYRIEQSFNLLAFSNDTAALIHSLIHTSSVMSFNTSLNLASHH